MAYSQRAQFQGHVQQVNAATASLNPGSVAATTTNTASTITVPGAAVGDEVCIVCTTAMGNAIVVTGEVTAANTVTVKFQNCTAGALTPAGGAANYTAICYKYTSDVFT